RQSVLSRARAPREEIAHARSVIRQAEPALRDRQMFGCGVGLVDEMAVVEQAQLSCHQRTQRITASVSSACRPIQSQRLAEPFSQSESHKLNALLSAGSCHTPTRRSLQARTLTLSRLK